MTIPKLAPYSMDAFRASSGNNEYTRLLFITVKKVKKRGPVLKPVDLDETQIQFESNPGPSRRKLWKLLFYSLWLEFPNCVQ